MGIFTLCDRAVMAEYNFRFWHLVVLNIQTKKRNRLALFSPLLTVQLKLLMHSLNMFIFIIRSLTRCGLVNN